MYNGKGLQHVLLVRIEALKKKIAASTLSSTNVNPVWELRCDLFGETRQNGHSTLEIYVLEAQYVRNYHEQNHYFNIYPMWDKHLSCSLDDNHIQSFSP